MEIIPCRKATFLISKKHEHELTWHERFQLLIHLIVCEFCRRFSKQTKIIISEVNNSESLEKLSEDDKQEMRELLNKL
jgi:hypothetical protein